MLHKDRYDWQLCTGGSFAQAAEVVLTYDAARKVRLWRGLQEVNHKDNYPCRLAER